MAPRNQRTAPATDNRAQSAALGTPEAQVIDLGALTNPDNVVEGRSPEFSMAPFVAPEPEQTLQGQPAPAPAAPAPAAPPSPPAPVASSAPEKSEADADKYDKMSPEELKKVVRNQDSMIGRQSEEVGSYRKLFDKFATSFPSPAVPAPQPAAPDPVIRFLKPKLSEEEKQELIALNLTDPEKHEEIQFARFRARMAAEERQKAMMEEAEKVRDIVTSPEFRDFERTLPPSVIQTAMHDPNTLRWVIQQFNGKSPSTAPAPEAPVPTAVVATAPVAQATSGARTVRLGTAAGAPSAGGAPTSTAPTFTRAQLMQMMVENPQEYSMRQAEIVQAYRDGRVR